MTAEEVYKLCVDSEKELKDLGYDVPKIVFVLEYNSINTMGRCIKKNIHDFFIIQISKFHWMNAPKELVRSTIIHELTHAIDRNKNSHNMNWQRLANEVAAKANTTITMYAEASPQEEAAAVDRAVAYLDCSKCGSRHYVYRRTKVYKQQGRGYICQSCGPETLTFVKLK